MPKRTLNKAKLLPEQDRIIGYAEAGPRAEVFANAVKSHSDLREPSQYAEEIRRLWGEAARKFLAIGEYLLQAKEHFAYGEKARELEKLLPFTYSTANRLMRIAEAVRLNRLPRERLPANYATAYVLTTMNDSDLDEAKRRNLVREDVTRKALEDFMAERRQPEEEARHVLLRRERERVASHIDRLKARLKEIDALLSASGPPILLLADGRGGE
jgi:Protein of unknown function (DUF3102)